MTGRERDSSARYLSRVGRNDREFDSDQVQNDSGSGSRVRLTDRDASTNYSKHFLSRHIASRN